jgi:hypothetical protein
MGGHGSYRNTARGPDRYRPTRIAKVPANSVPYGSSISRNGNTVWAAYDGEVIVAVGATATEVRAKYRVWCHRNGRLGQGSAEGTGQNVAR